MKKPYDWNRRPLGAPLPRGNVRRGALPPREPGAPPPDRTAVRIILVCVVVALAIPIAASFAFRGSARDPKGARNPETAPNAGRRAAWGPTPGVAVVEPLEGTPEAPVEVAVIPPPADLAAPEHPPHPKESAAPPAAAGVKKAPRKGSAPDKAKPAGRNGSGENRLFTLELSGTLGEEELDPGDSQTWARLSYFLRKEARSPHFLVYPDGSIPVSVPQGRESEAAPASSLDGSAEPEGDTDAPAYRLVIEAAAKEGAGVTFYRQRLGRTFRSWVSCRIEKRAGDELKVLGQVSAEESTTLSRDSGSEPATLLRQVYDASIQKLLKQLAGQPPFAR